MSTHHENQNLNITESFSKVEKYIEDNKKILSIIIGCIVILAGGYFAYKKLYIDPQEKEAQAQMFVAERYFEMDSLNLAINGDGNYLGFESIIDQYGMTPSGNLAHYYLGMCYLKKGDYKKAIDMLESYNANDDITKALAVGAIGDAYMELKKTGEAAEYYTKAANFRTNNFTTPVFLMKAGMAYEELGQLKNALSAYEQIKKNFSTTQEGREVDRYIAKIKVQVK